MAFIFLGRVNYEPMTYLYSMRLESVCRKPSGAKLYHVNQSSKYECVRQSNRCLWYVFSMITYAYMNSRDSGDPGVASLGSSADS